LSRLGESPLCGFELVTAAKPVPGRHMPLKLCPARKFWDINTLNND
jgi:hypothetical protein